MHTPSFSFLQWHPIINLKLFLVRIFTAGELASTTYHTRLCVYVCLSMCMCLCIWICICANVYVVWVYMPQHICRGQRTICRGWFSLFGMWVQRIDFRLSGVAASAFTCWAISPLSSLSLNLNSRSSSLWSRPLSGFNFFHNNVYFYVWMGICHSAGMSVGGQLQESVLSYYHGGLRN